MLNAETAAYSPDGVWFAFTAHKLAAPAGSDIYLWHAGDAEKHSPTYCQMPAGSNVENVPTLRDGQRARDWIERRVQLQQRLSRRPANHRAGR